jgi:hypothetical protein
MPILSFIRTGVTIGGLSLVLVACQTFRGPGLIDSAVTAELTPAGAASIASDVVVQLGTHIGPGSTTFSLDQVTSPFGSALEKALRGAGYAVVGKEMAKGPEVVALAYAVDSFDGSVMVRLSTLSLDVTRLYRLEGDDAVPASPVSVMRRNEVPPK